MYKRIIIFMAATLIAALSYAQNAEVWKAMEKPLNFDPFGQVEFAPLALM